MLVVIEATDLPGRSWDEHADIHVALQVGREPVGAVRADGIAARWETEVEVSPGDPLDFRGPAVQGKRGERFLYLTWVDRRGSEHVMFRRAKLMLADLGPGAATATRAVGRLALTDAKGAPLCARVKPSAIAWTLS